MLLVGLRGETVGIDTCEYVNYYQYDVSDMDYFNTSYEVLYRLLANFLRRITTNYHFFFFISSLIQFFFLKKAIDKFSVNPLFSVFIFFSYWPFFFFESLNIMRQSIAMPIVLCSIGYWNNNEKLKSVLLVIIASLFHVSSLIVLVFFLIKNVSINKGVTYFLLTIAFIYGIIGGLSINNSFGNFLSFADVLSVSDKFNRYAETGNSNVVSYCFNTLPFLFLSFISLSGERRINAFYENILYLTTICICVFIVSFSVINRLMLGPASVILFLVPLIYKRGTQKQKLLIKVFSFFMLCYIIAYIFFMDRNIVPYVLSF